MARRFTEFYDSDYREWTLDEAISDIVSLRSLDSESIDLQIRIDNLEDVLTRLISSLNPSAELLNKLTGWNRWKDRIKPLDEDDNA